MANKHHTQQQTEHGLSWRVLLQGTPCEASITDNDNEKIWRMFNAAIRDLVDSHGLRQAADREMARDRLMKKVVKAARNYDSSKSGVRTFLKLIMRQGVEEMAKHYHRKKRDTFREVSLEFSITSSEYEVDLAEAEQIVDVCAPDVARAAARHLDLQDAFKTARANPELGLLIEALIKSKGVRDNLHRELGWSDFKCRKMLHLLEKIFKDFLK